MGYHYAAALGDKAGQVLAFRLMSLHLFSGGPEEVARRKIFDHLRKTCSSPTVKLHCPDWATVWSRLEAEDPVRNSSSFSSLLHSPGVVGRPLLRDPAGSPILDPTRLLVDPSDLEGVSQVTIHSAWKCLVVYSSVYYVPGGIRVLLVTDRAISAPEILENTTDRVPLASEAAKSWCGFEVSHEIRDCEFFFLYDETKFRDVVREISTRVQSDGCGVVALMLGHIDVVKAVAHGVSSKNLALTLACRLILLASSCKVRVVFGGLVRAGPKQTQQWLDVVHRDLFSRCNALTDCNVFFVDVSSPSPNSDRPSACYSDEESLSDQFKVVSLFALSRLVAMTENNLLIPSQNWHPERSEALFLEFCSMKRAGL